MHILILTADAEQPANTYSIVDDSDMFIPAPQENEMIVVSNDQHGVSAVRLEIGYPELPGQIHI